MSKILIRKAQGTMGMGTGTDTRIYNPRSESSTMFRHNHEDEYTVTGTEDGRHRDEKTEMKKRKRKERAAEMKKLRHVKIKPGDLPPTISDDDPQEEDDKLNSERDISAQTGPAGNMGYLTSLANQARGPGAAGGHAFAMSEPMDVGFRLLKEEMDEFEQQKIAMQEAEQAAKEKAAQQVQDRMTAVPCPTCNAQVGEPCIGLNPNLGYPAHVKRMSLAHKGEPMNVGVRLLKREDDRQGFIGKPKKEKKKGKKVSVKERKARREKAKKWRPSTGEFKTPPGGMSPASATPRRSKARMRGIKGGKKEGLGRAHLAVEMSHRGIQTNQPTSKDPKRYRQYLGQQESRKRMGNVRITHSTPPRFGTRSYKAGKTGGGMLQGMMPGEAQLARRPALKPHRPPPLIPPQMPHAPQLPQVNMPSPPPIPQASRGVGVQSMANPNPMPARLPSTAIQGGPSMVMTSKVGVGSDIQKRGLSYYDTAELRQLVNEARRALKRKESKKKGMGDKDTSGAGSNLPNYNNAPTKETTNPTGATEDAKNDARTFSTNPLHHIAGRGGRTP